MVFRTCVTLDCIFGLNVAVNISLSQYYKIIVYSTVTLVCHATCKRHVTPPLGAIRERNMTPQPIIIYRHGPCHSARKGIKVHGMTPHSIIVYRDRTCHTTSIRYQGTGHINAPRLNRQETFLYNNILYAQDDLYN